MNDKRQLLCTFSSVKSYKTTIDDIKKFYNLFAPRFFVFLNLSSPNEALVTYNIVSIEKDFPKFPNTISIHRKKQTNTLYTLNAMNQIIKKENNGVFDKSFSVNWNLYKNSLVITGEDSVREIPIKILEILN